MQNPDGSFTYAPNAGFYGTDTIHFIAKDGQFLTSDDFTITVTINPVVAAVVGGSSVVTGDLLANDTNPNDAIVSVTLDAAGDNTFTADGLYGELVVNANGHYTYTLGFTSAEKANLVALGDGHSAQDVFTYTISDGTVSSDANLVVDVTNHVPTISVDAVAGDNVLNALEAESNLAISGTTSGVEDGQHVTLTFNGHNYDAVVTSNAWTTSVPSTDLAHAVLPDGSYTVTANVSDAVGNPATPATQTLKVDETAPTVAINTISGNNVLNALEAQSNLAISGTTSGVEDGQHVTLTFNGHNYDAVVTSNAWTTSVPSTDLAHAVLPDGSYTVTANVSDAVGNPATAATQTLKVDETAPTVAINTLSGDNVLNALEAQSNLTISGTTSGVENGQHVTLTFNGHNYDAVVTSNAWTTNIAASTLAHAVLPDGSYTVTANVSDAVGNPATAATQTLKVDETAPTVTYQHPCGRQCPQRA